MTVTAISAVTILAAGCGDDDTGGNELEAYQAQDAIDLAAQQIEIASWVAEDGQVHEDLVEYFPPDTGRAVELELRALKKDVDRLTDLPPEVQANLADAIKDTRLAKNGMSAMNLAYSLFNEAWDKATEESARKAYRAFGEVLIIPDGVDQYLTSSVDRTIEAAEASAAVLEDLGELDPDTETQIQDLIKDGENVQRQADDLGDDRESQLVFARQNLKKAADRLAAVTAAPVVPEGGCAVIPAENLGTVGVDVTVYAENCHEDSLGFVHQVYADPGYQETGSFDDGSSSCVTAGAWERFMSTCQTPFGEISFTAPGSA